MISTKQLSDYFQRTIKAFFLKEDGSACLNIIVDNVNVGKFYCECSMFDKLKATGTMIKVRNVRNQELSITAIDYKNLDVQFAFEEFKEVIWKNQKKT